MKILYSINLFSILFFVSGLFASPLDYSRNYEGEGLKRDQYGNEKKYKIEMIISKFDTASHAEMTYKEGNTTRSILLKFQNKGHGYYDILVPYTITPGIAYCFDTFCHMVLPGGAQYEESWRLSEDKLEKWGSGAVDRILTSWSEALFFKR